MTVRPALTKYEIAPLSLGLMAVLLRQQLEKKIVGK